MKEQIGQLKNQIEVLENKFAEESLKEVVNKMMLGENFGITGASRI